MLKILIVDDMPLFLDYLKGCIDWETYGFQICGEAHDGVEALKLVEEVFPDIILTDITMPYMDGLTLAEKVAKHYPDISVILITGNDEFEYARKAVKIGVCDYIVKPFEKEELLLSLLKQKDNINRALETKNLQAELDLRAQETYLQKLIFGRHRSWTTHKETLEENGIHFTSDYFLVFVLKLQSSQFANVSAETLHDWEGIIVDMLKGRLEIEGSFYVFKDFGDNIAVIMNFKNEKEMTGYKTYELTDLKKIIKSQLDLEYSVGVSSYCYSIDSIPTAYAQALRGLYNESNLESPQTEETDGTVSNLFSWDVLDNLTRGLEQMNEEMITSALNQQFETLQTIKDQSLHASLCSSLISILMTHLINSGRTIESIYGEDFNPGNEILGLEDPKAVEERIRDYYMEAIHYKKSSANTKSHQIVEQVLDYIHKNYMRNDLCIADISKETLINQTYLRSMFKSEMNQTITEYITKYRMTLARNMIQESDKKLSVIAEEVGYTDLSYFSKAFKKYYGVSPKNA